MCKEEPIRPKLPAANLLYLQCKKKWIVLHYALCSVVRISAKRKNYDVVIS